MSHLVPYTGDSNSEPWNQALQLEDLQLNASIPRSISNVEVLKTVDVLLAKWTNLDVPTRDFAESRTATGKTVWSKGGVEKATGSEHLGRNAERSDVKRTKANKQQPQELLRTKKAQLLNEKEIDDGNRESKSEDDASTQTDGVAERIGKERVGDNVTATENVQRFDSVEDYNSDDEINDESESEAISTSRLPLRETKARFAKNSPERRKEGIGVETTSDVSGTNNAPPTTSYTYPSVYQPSAAGPHAGYAQTVASHSQTYTSGPQIGHAPTIPSQIHPPDRMVPYGFGPQTQNPIPTLSWEGTYQTPRPYTMPIPSPPPPPEPIHSKTVDGKEVLARVEEMLLKNKEENISREKAGLAQIDAANAARERTYRKEMEAAVSRANMNAERVIAESAAKAQKEAEIKESDMENAVIHFKDAVGRRFIFPFKLCRTWRVGVGFLSCYKR